MGLRERAEAPDRDMGVIVSAKMRSRGNGGEGNTLEGGEGTGDRRGLGASPEDSGIQGGLNVWREWS